jgi:hypothetical protein
MSLNKVKTGDPLSISASTFNTFIDAAKDFRNRKHNVERENHYSYKQSGIIHVRNDSGVNLDQYSVMGIDVPVIVPTDNEDGFKRNLVLSCINPVLGTHDNKFVILADPIMNGRIGRAYIDGVCAVKIAGAGDTAGITNNDPSKLTAGGVGATVLWWDETTTWGIVRIGGKSNTGLYKITGGPQSDGTNYYYVGYKQRWTGTALANDGTAVYLYFPNNTGELPESEVYGHYHEGLDLGWTITAAGVAYPVIICTGHLGQSDFVPPPPPEEE